MKRSRLSIAFEAALLLGALVVVNHLLDPGRPGFHGLRPHPYYAPVLLITARYGFGPGLWTAGLASALYFAQVLLGVELASWRDLLAFENARPMILMLAGAALLGMIVDAHLRRVRRLEEEVETLGTRQAALESDQKALRGVNAQLASRIVGTDGTVPTLYRYAKALNVPEEDDIYAALVEVLIDAIKAEQAAVYTVEPSGFALHSGTGPRNLELPSAVERRLLSGQRLSLGDAPVGPEGPPFFLAGPLRDGEGAVVAVLVVGQIEFLRYNDATVRLFDVFVDWAAQSIHTARRLAALPASERDARRRAARGAGLRTAQSLADTGRLDLSQTNPHLGTQVDEEQPPSVDEIIELESQDIILEAGSGLAAELAGTTFPQLGFATLISELGDYLEEQS